MDGVCATLNHACTVLEQDFREVLHSRVRAGFPSDYYFQQAYNMVQSSIQQGKLQSSDTEKTKAQFLVCIFLRCRTYNMYIHCILFITKEIEIKGNSSWRP